MKTFSLIFVILTCQLMACSQTKKTNDNIAVNRSYSKTTSPAVGGGCEGCEAIYESPVPFARLKAVDTLPGFNEPGPKLEVSGIVYQRDGKTPAGDVVIYVYHTDQKGVYSGGSNETTWSKRHGHIRGWLKTGKDGSYKFYTLRPAAYPGRRDAAHIHVTVKEPGKNEYWIDEYLFSDDPLLTDEQKKHIENRGGDGILKTVQSGGMLRATRDIILGLNVPAYPK
jgi:protocatechuate 3,4-dioxygenase, beta subunit